MRVSRPGARTSDLAAAADHLVRRDPVHPIGDRAHELDPAAGDDIGPEPVGPQVVEDLDHRLEREARCTADGSAGCSAPSNQSRAISLNSSLVMPACVAPMICSIPASPAVPRAAMSPSSTAWKGWVVFHSGCSLASCLDPVQGERQLDVERLLRPERPVVVEDGEALRDGHLVRTGFISHGVDEREDGSLRVTLVPGRQRIRSAHAFNVRPSMPERITRSGWLAGASRHRSCDYDRCSSFRGETDGEPAHHAARARRRPVSIARRRLGLGGPMDRRAHLRRCLPGAREGERRGADPLPLRPRRGRLRRPRRAGAGGGGRHDRLATR